MLASAPFDFAQGRPLSQLRVLAEDVLRGWSMPHMYILECADGSYYTGSTTHLELRLRQHQEGCGANHTAKRLPVRLVYYEFFEHVADAFDREKQVQGWSRKKKEALMAGETNLLHGLAECQNETHYGFASGGFGSLRLRSGQAAKPPGDGS